MQALPWILIGAGLVALIKGLRDPGTMPAELQQLTITSTGLPNKPPAELWPMLFRLLEFVQGLRGNHPGAIVTSAYRSPAVNQAVGGVTDSLHMAGRAIDFRLATDAATLQLFRDWKSEPWRVAGLISKAIYYANETPRTRFHVELAEPGTAPDPRLILRETIGIDAGEQ